MVNVCLIVLSAHWLTKKNKKTYLKLWREKLLNWPWKKMALYKSPINLNCTTLLKVQGYFHKRHHSKGFLYKPSWKLDHKFLENISLFDNRVFQFLSVPSGCEIHHQKSSLQFGNPNNCRLGALYIGIGCVWKFKDLGLKHVKESTTVHWWPWVIFKLEYLNSEKFL